MQRSRILTHAAVLALLAGLGACSSDNTVAPATSSLLNDQLVNNDVAVSSGDAIVTDIGQMVANEVFAGMAPAASFDLFGSPLGLNVSRSKTCYDQNDQVQAQCNDTTTSYIVFHLQLDGSFSGAFTGPEGTDTMSAVVHRLRDLTISGLLGHETSRTHDGVGSAHDTTDFVGIHETRTLRRHKDENALDSVISVVFDLPHASNPWPVSGKIVRYVDGTVSLQVNDSTWTRSFNRRVEVDFPPDNQANVTLTITYGSTTKTCLLNLVTRRVTGCQ